jgi:ABC-2 type transport system permease protein
VVAELLRLKVRLLSNGFRIPRTAVWASVGILLAVATVLGAWVGMASLHHLDEGTALRVISVGGTVISAAAFLGPLMVARSELLDPRALRGYIHHRSSLVGGLLLLTLVGPGALLVPLALVPLAYWQGSPQLSALLVAPLIVLEGLLAARLGVAVGSGLQHRPRWSAVTKVVAGVLLAGGVIVLAAHFVPWAAALLPGSAWRWTLPVVVATAPLRHPAIAEALGASPIGALWRLPVHQATGADDLAQRDLVFALGTIGVLGALWVVRVWASQRATRRQPREVEARVPGWFRHLPSTPVGAVMARTATYWRRDPRYYTALFVLPLIPVVVIAAGLIAGVPFEWVVLVPLPVMVLLLSWATLHNDVAYDSTALWTHVVAHTRGVDDRIGRAAPVITLGLVLVAIGVPLTAWGYGDPIVVPPLLGVCAALLLGGAGVSSAVSARFPYPVPRPGDKATQHPQVEGASGANVQAGSLLLILVVAAPALAAGGAWLVGMPGPWPWVAFASGIGAGAVALALGIRVGGRGFDRRAPELLAFTMRH